jgi:Tol biopolymer transport system component
MGARSFFSSNRAGGFSLWRVAASGGVPEPIAGVGQNAYSPAISRQGDRMVYNVSFVDSDIWRCRDGPGPGRHGAPSKLIGSTRPDHSPRYSPDGRRVVFVSDRSGSNELWVCDGDGSSPAQLNNFLTAQTSAARAGRPTRRSHL